MSDRRGDVIRLLTAYRPADPDEQRHRSACLELLAAAPDPFDRYAYHPGHVTASGWVVHPAGDRVLLIHHAKLGIWVQPGGHVDPTDVDLVAAARREIEEETGLVDLHLVEGILDIDIHDFPARGDQPDHEHYDVRFGFVASTARLDPNDEAHDARWVTLEGLGELGVDRSVTRPARKLIG
jgi:8-oxo-dGTP pyrophosphatase MutT (NUDIX family)